MATIFCPKSPKKLYYKSFDVDILAFEKRPYYCGDKFGDFSPKAGDFFSETPGHTVWVKNQGTLRRFCNNLPNKNFYIVHKLFA